MTFGNVGLGAIGTGAGEAQILQGNKGLDVLLRRQQQRQANARWQMQLGLQVDKQREARDRELMKNDYTKPGVYQQENSINEINELRDLTRNYALNNPNSSVAEINEAVSKKRKNVERRVAKRNEMQPVLKEYQAAIQKDPKIYDKEALKTLHDNVLYDVNPETGKVSHKDIDQIEPEHVQGILQHPSAYNAVPLITDMVGPIKAQMTYAPTGTVINTPFGQIEKSETQGVRFKNLEETTNYVIHSDPRIENKLYWDVAKDQLKAAGQPESLQAVQEVYDKIRNDPKFNSLVYAKAEPILNQLQQEVNKKYTKQIGTYTEGERTGATPTEEDYKITHDRIQQIRTEAHDVAKTISHPGTGMTLNVKYHNDKFEKLIAPLADGGVWDGKQIVKAEPEVKDGKYKIHLRVMDGTQTDLGGNKKELLVDRYVDVNNDEQMFGLLNQLHGKKKHEKMNANQYMKLHGKSDEAANLGLK